MPHAEKALLKNFHVRSLSLVGSVVRGEAGMDSDADILVEFEPDAEIALLEFIRLKNALSDVLGISVDFAKPDTLHPALKDDILREALHVA